MDNDDAQALLTHFGYDGHTARLIAAHARRNKLTYADIEAWIAEAYTSQTIHNPLGFVRARIQRGDKPPSPSASRSTHDDRQRYVSQFFCPDCQTSPCICDYDPMDGTIQDYRQRKIQEERSQS